MAFRRHVSKKEMGKIFSFKIPFKISFAIAKIDEPATQLLLQRDDLALIIFLLFREGLNLSPSELKLGLKLT